MMIQTKSRDSQVLRSSRALRRIDLYRIPIIFLVSAETPCICQVMMSLPYSEPRISGHNRKSTSAKAELGSAKSYSNGIPEHARVLQTFLRSTGQPRILTDIQGIGNVDDCPNRYLQGLLPSDPLSYVLAQVLPPSRRFRFELSLG